MSVLRLTVLRLLLVLMLFTICRLFFGIYNVSHFNPFSFYQIIEIGLKGIRFDLSVLLLLNSPLILIAVWDMLLGKNYSRWHLLNWFFIAVNSVALLLNFIDIFWFQYIQKRAGTGIFAMLHHGDHPLKLIQSALRDYWWGLIFFVGIVWMMGFVNNKYIYKTEIPQRRFLWALILIIGVVIGIRGGLQLRPISVANASDCSHPDGSQIILNAPFCIIQEWAFPGIEIPKYMPSEKARNYIKGENQAFEYHTPRFPIGTNFICIITESLSAEFCGFLNDGKGYTPFLDSLAQHAVIAENFYASGKQSIEGIPALMSGIPALLDEPMMTSIYAANQIPSIPANLKPFNYYSAFFHGGRNGTMNFDLYTKHAGFDAYFGKNEYVGATEDDDGQWGIFDEPFGIYVVKKIKSFKQPYFATWFTLSSHQPYIIPVKYKNRFPKGDEEIHESIGYADYAIRRFFEQLKKEGLLNSNTCVVITADHTGPAGKNNHSRKEQHRIPLMIYYNGHTGRIRETMSQTDLPEILLKGMNHRTGLFSNKTHHTPYAFNYYNNTWEIICDSGYLDFNGKDIYAAEGNISKASMLRYLKALMVTHHEAMKNNRLQP